MNKLIVRQIEIIQYLQKDNKSVSIESLGLLMNVSSKTIKNDIDLINKELEDNGAYIKKNYGLIELVVTDINKFEEQITETYKDFCESFFLSQANGQYIFLLKEILFARNSINQNVLTKKMFLSSTSFYKLCKRIQDDCQFFDIEWITKKNEGLTIKGLESKKREFFISKVYEFCKPYPKYIYNVLVNYILPNYKKVKSSVLEVLSYHKYYISDNSFEILVLYISFAIERMNDDFSIDEDNTIKNAALKHKRTSHIVKDILNSLIDESTAKKNKNEYYYMVMLIISNTELMYPIKLNEKASIIVEDFFKMLKGRFYLDLSKENSLVDLLTSQLSCVIEKKVNVDSKGLSIDALKKISPYEHILAYSFYSFLKEKWNIKLTKNERSSVAIIFASYLINRNPLLRNNKYLLVTSHNSSISLLLREYLRKNTNEKISLDVIGTSEIFNKYNLVNYSVILTTEYEFYKKNRNAIYITDIYKDIYSTKFYEKIFLSLYGCHNPKDIVNAFDEDKFKLLNAKECEKLNRISKQEYIDYVNEKLSLDVDNIAYINSPIMAFNYFVESDDVKIYTLVNENSICIDDLHQIDITFIFAYNPKIFSMFSIFKIYNFLLLYPETIIEEKTYESLINEVNSHINKLL